MITASHWLAWRTIQPQSMEQIPLEMTRIKIAFLLALTLSTRLMGQSNQERLTEDLSKHFKTSHLPGFAVAIVNADSILYQESFGFENIQTKTPFSLSKRFYVASITKTFIGIGLMKLLEEGKLALSTPINDILPFEVVNPHYKDNPITVEHLARHTSSILNGNLALKSWYLDDEFDFEKKEIGKMAFNDFTSWAKNTKMELGDFLKESLSSEGSLYSKKTFSKTTPGAHYEYSNVGAALAAYIIELKTGVSFDQYVENFITNELHFKPGVWRHHQGNELPITYFQTQVEAPIHRPSLYPTGGMMLSCEELALYVKEMINGYEGKSQILHQDSFLKMMSSPDIGKGGLFWELNGDTIGHNGGNYGVTCFMGFDKTTGIGKLFMTNISSYKNGNLLQEMIAIWKKLSQYESTL